jgi:hypothetical protein
MAMTVASVTLDRRECLVLGAISFGGRYPGGPAEL